MFSCVIDVFDRAPDGQSAQISHGSILGTLRRTNPMLDSLKGGTYGMYRGGMLGSLISLPMVKRAGFATATSAVSPTADAKASSPDARPLPIDW
jgi:hypothetical protein